MEIEVSQKYEVIDGVKQENKVHISFSRKDLYGRVSRLLHYVILSEEQAKYLVEKLSNLSESK